MSILNNHSKELVEIYVKLLGDEDGTLRPTQAISLGNNLYKILPIPNYDIADEEWEFVPNSIVRCEEREYRKQPYLFAIERVA